VAIALDLVAYLIAIIISFYVSKHWLRDRLKVAFQEQKWFKIMSKMLEDSIFKSLIFIRLMETPLFLKNYGLPLFDIQIH
jgi:uncharacterized membrane protein YdjX (TVP38/TMEM64 family)